MEGSRRADRRPAHDPAARRPTRRRGAAVRQKVRTVAGLDRSRGREVAEFLTLPSGGDTSYPGLVWHDGLLWVSYYSSHEGKTSIYLAKVKLRQE